MHRNQCKRIKEHYPERWKKLRVRRSLACLTRVDDSGPGGTRTGEEWRKRPDCRVGRKKRERSRDTGEKFS